jgi:hypothetical protein
VRPLPSPCPFQGLQSKLTMWSGTQTVIAVAIVAVTASCGPPDPILNARDCREIYELHGATGPQGELRDFPPLTVEEIGAIRAKVTEFGTENDPVCISLLQEMDRQESQ